MTFSAEINFVKKARNWAKHVSLDFDYEFWRFIFLKFLISWRNCDRNEANVEVLSISHTLPIWSHINNNHVCLALL